MLETKMKECHFTLRCGEVDANKEVVITIKIPVDCGLDELVQYAMGIHNIPCYLEKSKLVFNIKVVNSILAELQVLI